MTVLETDRLILRKWRSSDKEDLFEYGKHDLVGPNAGWKPHKNLDESVETIKMFMANEDVYAIELKSEKKVIGGFGIHKCTPDPELKKLKQRELGYVLNPNYWGNGYVPEAVYKAINYCFKEMKLDLLWCAHYDFNSNSKRVNEKCGFKYQFSKEAVIKGLENKKVTTLYYSISSEDFTKI